MEFQLLTEHPDIYSSKRLICEARDLKLDAFISNPYQMTMQLKNSKRKKMDRMVFHRTTGLRWEDYDLRISQYLQMNGATVFNDPKIFLILRDKEMQAVFFSGHNLPIIPTYSFRDRPNEKTKEEILNFLGPYLSDNAFILKTLRGNQGIGVNLVYGMQSLYSLLESFWAIKDQNFIIQPFLEKRKEYRVLISAGSIIGTLLRSPIGADFRSNSQRGNATTVPFKKIPKEVYQLAMKVYETSRALFLGIDIATWEGQTFIIEVNLVPGFKQVEQLCGVNVARKVINDALSILSEKKKKRSSLLCSFNTNEVCM